MSDEVYLMWVGVVLVIYIAAGVWALTKVLT